MTTLLPRLTFCALTLAAGLAAETLGNRSLAGPYHFVLLQVTTAGSQVTEAVNLAGTMTFDGAGNYSYTAEIAAGAMDFSPAGGSGPYQVNSRGTVVLRNPLDEALSLDAMLSSGGGVLLGSTTTRAGGEFDIFIAIQATGDISNATLQGAYTGGAFEFPVANPSAFRSSVFSLASGGTGTITGVSVIGHERGGPKLAQSVTDATYALASDGTGTMSFGDSASLLAGARKVFVSGDGDPILGYSEANTRGVFVAARNHAGPSADFAGQYWVAEMTFEEGAFSSASGALFSRGDGVILVSERVRFEGGVIDFSGLNYMFAIPNGRGWFANRPLAGETNMHLGVTEATGRAAVLVGAELGHGAVGLPTSDDFGVFFAVRAPTFDSKSLFLDPTGVVNGASFAVIPIPLHGVNCCPCSDLDSPRAARLVSWPPAVFHSPSNWAACRSA